MENSPIAVRQHFPLALKTRGRYNAADVSKVIPEISAKLLLVTIFPQFPPRGPPTVHLLSLLILRLSFLSYHRITRRCTLRRDSSFPLRVGEVQDRNIEEYLKKVWKLNKGTTLSCLENFNLNAFVLHCLLLIMIFKILFEYCFINITSIKGSNIPMAVMINKIPQTLIKQMEE